MKASESRLKPCPFCGGAAEIMLDSFGANGFRIGCASKPTENTCPGCIRWSAYYRNEEMAIAAWNRRAYEIKAEHKRENRTGEESSVVGNAEAMRKALDSIYNKLETLDIEEDSYADEVIASVKSDIVDAIYAPPRNCDVGTAEEQGERFEKFCDSNKHGGDVYACDNCKFLPSEHCGLKWAQMPCEIEAVAKCNKMARKARKVSGR